MNEGNEMKGNLAAAFMMIIINLRELMLLYIQYLLYLSNSSK